MFNVLIVEDDFRIANIHEGYLKKIRSIQNIYKVTLAKEASPIVGKYDIDLVLVDIYIPDQMGIDLIKDLKKEYPYLNFIIITASKSSKLLEESLRIGVFYYLIKPVTLHKFEEVIQTFEEGRTLMHENELVSQSLVDAIFKRNMRTVDQNATTDLPKGINQITLNNIKKIMKESMNGLTVEDVSQVLGSSRTTARRYLEYLVAKNEVQADIEYGIVGRPQRKYVYVQE